MLPDYPPFICMCSASDLRSEQKVWRCLDEKTKLELLIYASKELERLAETYRLTSPHNP